MTYNGILNGSCIELESRPPYPDGQEVIVHLEPACQHPRGSARAILEAISQAPHLTQEDWEEFDRILNESKIPMETQGLFDEDEPG